MAFDEMRGIGKGKRVREPYRGVSEWLEGHTGEELHRKSSQAESMFRRTGITFAVYGAQEASERLIPFDIVPRIISAVCVPFRNACDGTLSEVTCSPRKCV